MASYSIPLSSLDSCFCIVAFAKFIAVDASGNTLYSGVAWGDGIPFPSSLNAMYIEYCEQVCSDDLCNIEPGDFRTQTIGGYGAPPHGGNPGTYVHANFDAAFPGCVTIGFAGGYTMTFTSADAITTYLPDGGTPAVLTESSTNSTGIGNTLASQVLALSLSIGFDVNDADYGTSDLALGDLVVTVGTFEGWTVYELLAEANNILGGCSSAYTASQINEAITAINENFDGGEINGTFLTCPE